jgi:sortase A
MQPELRKRLVSNGLIATATVLLFFAGREFLGSRIGQFQAGRTFSNAAARPAPEYFKTRPGETIAKMTIPRLHTQLFVIEGDGPDQLRRGPGHLSDTAPLGTTGNSVIAGHRDTHFRVLKDIRKGDSIVIETRRKRFLYTVSSTKIVGPQDTSALRRSSSAELNLITCYPFHYVGNAPRRFVVEARPAS